MSKETKHNETKVRKRTDAQANYDLILQTTAVQVAQTHRNPTIREISQHSGVSEATIYRHFPNRNALLIKVRTQKLCDRLEPIIATTIRENPNPVEGLRELALAQVSMSAEQITELNDLPGWIDGYVEEFTSRFGNDLFEATKTAQEQGYLRSDLTYADIGGVTRLFLGGLTHTRQSEEQSRRYIDIWFDAVSTTS